MKIILDFQKEDFSSILEGERDFDLLRQLSRAIRARLSKSMRATIGNAWLKHTLSGREEFLTLAGPIGSSGFSLARMHSEGGFYAWDFRISVDVPNGKAAPITEVEAGNGLDFSHSTTIHDGRLWPPTFKFRAMARWDRHSLRCYSLHIDACHLPFDLDVCRECTCPTQCLRPVCVSAASNILHWICICCGSLYLCECSRGYLEALQVRDGYDNREYLKLGQTSSYRDEICHLCRGMPSEIQYRSEMYGGPIYQHYFPYILQEASLHNIDKREGENRVRDRLGLPRIGEGWVSEMMAINAARLLFPDLRIDHQASPPWLGRQRYDGYIAEYGIAIEYNGEQHYRAIEAFGGEAGLRSTQGRDRRKVELSKQHGIEVVVFRFDENITEEVIRKRIETAIKLQASSRTPTTT